MTPTNLSSLITDAAPALANHLWQSTAFAATIWLLTLLLRNNHARIRYSLWLTASIKFLIPFSLLITIGTLLPRPQQIAPLSTIYSAIDTASQPFTQFDSTLAPAPHLKTHFTAQLPAALATLWLCGVLTALLIWLTRWRQVHATLKTAIPITVGREHEILRRLLSQLITESQSSLTKPITLALSTELMEPGVFGIFRPTILWPHRLSDQLEEHHIEAILAHEIIHIRRRDNLTAALHMLVEAIFWFHPIVWWMERHMIEEREQACDEAVVQQSGDPETCAESILRACRFCLESPLPCISGITGAELSRRVRSIMTTSLNVKLSLGKTILLAAVGGTFLFVPFAAGFMGLVHLQAQLLHDGKEPLPSFNVATIKPSSPDATAISFGLMTTGFNAKSQSLIKLIEFAYAIKSKDQLPKGPNWTESQKFDIEAKLDSTQIEVLKKLPPEQRFNQYRLMVQSLLADRFQLKMHAQMKELAVYALVIAKAVQSFRKQRTHLHYHQTTERLHQPPERSRLAGICQG